MIRKHKYKFVEEWDNRGQHFVKIRHSAYGEQTWVRREAWYKNTCHGTGKTIEPEEPCYSLTKYHDSQNRKRRLSVEFVDQLKANPGEFM